MTLLPTPPGSRRGYTLMEILVAMIIAVFVFVSVSALLPAAIWLQKQASSDLRSQMTARSAAGLLHGCRYSRDELDAALPRGSQGLELFDPVSGASPLHPITTNPPKTSRSEPSYLAVANRSYYWHPLVRRVRPVSEQTDYPPANANEFEVFVLVMRRDSGQADPTGGVRKASVSAPIGGYTFTATGSTFAPEVIPGDIVVASNGVSYRVKTFTPTVITVQSPIVGTTESGSAATAKAPTGLWYWPAVAMPGESIVDDGAPRVTRVVVVSDAVE